VATTWHCHTEQAIEKESGGLGEKSMSSEKHAEWSEIQNRAVNYKEPLHQHLGQPLHINPVGDCWPAI